MQSGLDDTRILVTGASGGIGRAIAVALAAEGARVLVHCHSNRAAAEEVAGLCGDGAVVVSGDLRAEADVERLYAGILADGERLDGVVANAGIWIEEHVPVHRMTLAQWEETFAADLTSVFLTVRGFFRHLADRPRDDAAVVLIGSTAGLFGEAGHADYATAKAGMAHGLTASLKNEIVRLAPRGRVNCVCPGWVRTPMAEGALADPVAVAEATATTAMHKIAQPEDVARAVVYLMSPALAGHITGTVLPVDGGMEGRLLHRP